MPEPIGSGELKRKDIRRSIGKAYDHPEAKIAFDRGNKKVITEDLIDDIIARRQKMFRGNLQVGTVQSSTGAKNNQTDDDYAVALRAQS